MALSKTQNKRLGVILSVMFKEETPQELLQEVLEHGFVEKVDNTFQLTDKGIDEKTDSALCRDLILNTLAKNKLNPVISLIPSNKAESLALSYLSDSMIKKRRKD